MRSLKWIKELYEWGSFMDALSKGLQMTFGISVIGGMGAAITGAIVGASGYEIALFAAVAIVGINLVGIHKILKQRALFEILFDHSDSRFAEPLDQGGFRYHAALHILAPHTIDHPNVWALKSPFATRVILPYHGANPTHASGNVQVYSGGAIDQDVTEHFPLFELPERKFLSLQGPNDPLLTVQRFTLEARGRNCKAIREEFEYDPNASPMIRMLPK